MRKKVVKLKLVISIGIKRTNILTLHLLLILACLGGVQAQQKQPVDYINPYIGNISHLLTPTYPTIHLPNSMVRVYPERADYTGDQLKGFPILVTSHRGRSAFNIFPYQGNEAAIKPVMFFSYDNEMVKPYYYTVTLDEQQTEVKFAPSHQSALYTFQFVQNKPTYIVINVQSGKLQINNNAVSGYQVLKNNSKAYLYLETEQTPLKISQDGNLVKLFFGEKLQAVKVRYGVSFISEVQAQKNLRREIKHYSIDTLATIGRKIWNKELGKISIKDNNLKNKTVFYTALYRCLERPIQISEDGNYFSAFDGKIHPDEGVPFFTDDWIWDTYRAAHPLRILTDPSKELNIIKSYIRMAEQMPNLWMPTFPEVTGDSRRMNSNHGVAIVADALSKGIHQFDVNKAFLAAKHGIEQKTLAPWSAKPAGILDSFYHAKGYFPALATGEIESVFEVNTGEKRQPVAVTLGTSYDHWCLSTIAQYLGDTVSAHFYLQKSYNYRNIFNYETFFFHPKDKNGTFIKPFDYNISSGKGAREAYGENNGWIYRWDVPHNIADLMDLMGGKRNFSMALDSMFSAPLGRSKFAFYEILPDHTGNVGQFSMANEPAFHIPYLYNYAGEPWKTQKRIRSLMNSWFRDDLMGMPGDEDGGGMCSFLVFSSMGFYPVTPGIPAYNIGSPLFENVKIQLSNGRYFEIEALGCSSENKYIQSATLNDKPWLKSWFFHEEIRNGGKLILKMGKKPNYKWGVGEVDARLSAESMKNVH
jgi:predicted alpha-1,2-mannosidase